LALDSESRWRLVRAMRAKGAQPASNETTIRDAKVDDLTQIVEIYNYYIRNSVVTFDLDAMKLDEWQHKFEWVQSLKLPFVVAESAGGQILGFAYVAPWRQKAAYRRTVEDSIYLRPQTCGNQVAHRDNREK
jgi:L-amino acid N-acyltransferase YncA